MNTTVLGVFVDFVNDMLDEIRLAFNIVEIQPAVAVNANLESNPCPGRFFSVVKLSRVRVSGKVEF
jgi:hypothetical protein